MEKVNVHMPYSMKKKYLNRFLELHIAPEIYFTGYDIDRLLVDEIYELSKKLKKEKLIPSIHAPFLDINLAATDPAVIAVTKNRLMTTIKLASELEATGIVIHPGYDPYRFRGMEDVWFESAKRNLDTILKEAEKNKVFLAIENIFDEHYENIKRLIKFFSSKYLGHCFDTGHFNIFAKTSLEEWLTEMNEFIFALHLHDNLGYVDQHLPVGEGSFPFVFFFEKIQKSLKWQTLEMHNEESVVKCIKNMNELLNQYAQ